jgi:hypothetical protein
MHQDTIRCRTRPERAAVKEELIRTVHEDLAMTQPDGLSYATFLLADQVTSSWARRRCRPGRAWSAPSGRRARCRPCAPSASSRRASPTAASSSRSGTS